MIIMVGTIRYVTSTSMYMHNMCLHMYSGWNCFQNCLCANIAIFTDVHVHTIWQSSSVCVCVGGCGC